MPSARYPFARCVYPDGRIAERGRTYLPIRIVNPSSGLSRKTWCLLDTGAESCLIPAEIAVGLGHDLRGPGVKSSVASGIEQYDVPTYKHAFQLELLSSDLNRVYGGLMPWQSIARKPACQCFWASRTSCAASG